MPVMTVSQLADLIGAGKLDGRVGVVAGYWINSLPMSCPMPLRWMSPLEGYCASNVLSDTDYVGYTCQHNDDGSGRCDGHGAPFGAHTLNVLTPDDYGNSQRANSGATGPSMNGVPVVLIGHAGDARHLQCQGDVRADCRRAFVVDTVAWAAGQSFEVGPPTHPSAPKPHMSVADIVKAVGSDELVSTILVPASQASTIEPRINLYGENLVWIVRSLAASQEAGTTRSAVVSAVDDSTGEVVGTTPLEIAPDFAPAQFKAQATVPGTDSSGDTYPFFAIDRDGTTIHEALIEGGTASPAELEQHYAIGPAVMLEPGSYVVRGWRSTAIGSSQTSGPHADECTTQLTVAAGEHMRLEASFPKTGPCVWTQPTFLDSLY